MKTLLASFVLLLGLANSHAQTEGEADAKVKEFEKSLNWKQGEVAIPKGFAKMNVPEQFRFLDEADAKRVLTQAWGNPNADSTLGMIFPAEMGPFSDGSWAVVISYEDDGHINDDDAKTVDYAKLLKEMQEASAEQNEERKEQGVHTVDLIGWATPPTYDPATHKMYWAKELSFDGNPEHTLNYNIRVLGKEGVLVLNAVADMDQLAVIQKEAPKILEFVDFTPGNTYADYKKGEHKLAEYGVAGLVAGGLGVAAAKAGFFKFLIPIFLVLKKFAVVIVIGIVAAIKGLMGRKRKDQTQELK